VRSERHTRQFEIHFDGEERMYRPGRQRAIKEKHWAGLTGKPVPVNKTAMATMHSNVREAYLNGAGLYAFNLMLDLERALDDENPVNRDFEERYRKLCRQK
jgi:hypothetical protein